MNLLTVRILLFISSLVVTQKNKISKFDITRSFKNDTAAVKHSAKDSREAEQGSTIYRTTYIDQPYVVKLKNGSWLCTYTESGTTEGGHIETIGVSVSANRGKKWSFVTYLEPPKDTAAFYAIPFITAYGRVYVIYGYNNDNVLTLNGANIRTDAVGEMCYKYSDDNGLTWSSRRVIKMPVTEYDLINNWNGKYVMWWSICKPILSQDNQMYFSFTKIAQYLYTREEGWVVNSPNINSEKDATKIIWNFLPPGTIGIRSPTMGLVQEEHNIVQLKDGAFCCVFRTSNGYPAICYSHDGCKTWSEPMPLKLNNGLVARNPRACPRIFKFSNGQYILWFENNNISEWLNRNPAWVCGGLESEGVIKWSQPEVLLYSRDTTLRFSYPDMFQEGSDYYLTETQKSIARLHLINGKLLKSLWQQGTIKSHSRKNLITNLSSRKLAEISGSNYVYSRGEVKLNTGLTINLNLNLRSFSSHGQNIISFLSDNKKDTLIRIRTSFQNTIEVDVCNSGRVLTTFYLDNNLIKLNSPLFVSISMDSNSRILTAMVNGILCNGHGNRAYGWVIVPGIFNFGEVSANISILPFDGKLNNLQIYNRALTTGEMLSEYLAIE